MMEILEMEVLGNPLSAWATAVGIALAINVLVAIVLWAVRRHLVHLAGNTDTAVDDSIIRVAKATRQWLVFAVTLFLGTMYLELTPRVDTILKYVATVAAFLQLGLWAGAMVEFWLTRYRDDSDNAAVATSLGALNFVAKLVLWSLVEQPLNVIERVIEQPVLDVDAGLEQDLLGVRDPDQARRAKSA